jgi:hypothetical protein
LSIFPYSFFKIYSLFFVVGDMSTPTPEQRLKFLEKSRAKKAQPDNKVDVLSQLEVVEGDNKKKRKENPGRINVEIPGKGSSVIVIADEAVEAGGETRVISPIKKKRSLNKKDKKNKDTHVLEKDLQEIKEVVAETAHVMASQAGGSSPWDPLFNPEIFLEKMVDMAGNSSCFNTTPTDELLKMALGHELKGLLLNYALATHQRSEVATAKENEAIIDKNLASIEQDVCATKEKLKGEMEALKADYEEKVSKLVKAHEEELAKAKKDQ